MWSDAALRRTASAGGAGRAPSRRSVLTAGLAGFGGLLGTSSLTGCANPLAAASEGTLIRFWNLLSGGDGVLLQELLEDVRAQMPAATIENITLAWGAPYYTKLAMASAGGRSPEVAILHMSRLAGYAPGGLLEPWNLDLLEEYGVTEEDFAPAVWERAHYQGEVYAIPLDIHPFILFYNTEIAEEAGLLGPDGQLVPIDTPETFLDAARRMQEVTGDYGLSYGYVGDASQAWRGFYTFYPQTGAELDLSGDEVQIDRDAATRVVEFMQQVFDGTVANPADDYGSALAAFVAGRTGMFFSGDWELPTMRDADLPVDAMPIPALFGEAAAYGDSHSFVLPRQLEVNEERRRATHEFVARMLQNSLLWAQAGHIPAYQPVTESAEYAELMPQSHYVEAGENVQYDPAAWFTGSGSNFQNRVSQVLQPAYQGDIPAEEAVDRMVEVMNQFIDSPNPA
jgi:multiple sugar transport system substrate-binding protein